MPITSLFKNITSNMKLSNSVSVCTVSRCSIVIKKVPEHIIEYGHAKLLQVHTKQDHVNLFQY